MNGPAKCQFCGHIYSFSFMGYDRVKLSRQNPKNIWVFDCLNCHILIKEYLEDFPYEKVGQFSLNNWLHA